MSSDFALADDDDDLQGQTVDKDAERQERIKAKNRRAQKRYREKKLQETDHFKLQVSDCHAPLAVYGTLLACGRNHEQWMTALTIATK